MEQQELLTLFVSKENTEYTFSLAKFIKSKKFNMGDKVTFVLEKNTIDTGSGDTATVGGAGFGIPGNTHDGFIESQDGWSTTKGFRIYDFKRSKYRKCKTSIYGCDFIL